VDGSDRRRLLAMTATREGTAFLLLECFSRFGHAEHGMRKWARELVSSTSRRPAEAAGTPAVRASPFPVESTP
jgi:hypothetical protein